MEFLTSICNIIKCMVDCLVSSSEILKNIADILALVIGGVFAIKGFNYIKSLREKKATAIFGFWNHLAVKLIMIKNRLGCDESLINNLYSSDIRNSWQNNAAPPDDERVKEFLDVAKETLELIKSETDQLPAYKGWTNDYLKIIEFLDDVIYYDISNPTINFKFDKLPVDVLERNTYCTAICNTIENVINGIKKAQEDAEKHLY